MYFGWDNFSTVSFVYVPVLVRVSVFFLHLNTCTYYKKSKNRCLVGNKECKQGLEPSTKPILA